MQGWDFFPTEILGVERPWPGMAGGGGGATPVTFLGVSLGGSSGPEACSPIGGDQPN
jgi:hypothetical protein